MALMITFISRRLLALIPTLIVLSILAFLFVHALPGDPAAVILGPNATPAAIQSLRGTLGLDQPLMTQYGSYIAHLVHGDLGSSAVSQQPVATALLQRAPATIELAVVAILVGAPTGLAAGWFAARRAGTLLDSSLTAVSVIALSAPAFVLGLLSQFVFGVQFHLLPTIGRSSDSAATGWLILPSLLHGDLSTFSDAIAHLILPAVTLAGVPFAVVSRVSRAAFLRAQVLPHVRVAEAKGLPATKVRRGHIHRIALPPSVTVIGLQFGALLAGSIITENIFAWGGLGSLIVSAIHTNDYVVLQSCLLFIAVMYVLVNLLVDVVNALIDPRSRRTR